MPMAKRASRTSSSLCDWMIATMYFMACLRVCSQLVPALAVQADVEPHGLALGVHPKADERVDHLQDDVGDDREVDEGDGHAGDLDQQLADIALDQAGGTADRLQREDAGEHGADDAADAVDAEGVQRIVVAGH